MYAINEGPVTFKVLHPERKVYQSVAGSILREDDKLIIYSSFHIPLKDEIKSMDGSRWLGNPMEPNGRKAWQVKDSIRNRFRLTYLLGGNPYAPYDMPIVQIEPRRRKPNGSPYLYNHQIIIASHIYTRHQCIVAGEMGVGKTCAAIEAMEASGIREWLWVGPRSALDSVKYEFYNMQVCEICGKLGKYHRHENHRIQDSKMILPKFYTYEAIKTLVETWPSGVPAPRGIIMDECSRVKTPTAQRTQAAQALADAMRKDHGRDAFIVLMSGSPAPKDPTDWYSLAEIACPGFLREGNIKKFKEQLCLIKMTEGSGGGAFPKIVTWWDDERKCKNCGKFKTDPDHDSINSIESWYHEFEASKNKVFGLYGRLKGLVDVKFKRDCLDLPDKVYIVLKAKPSPSVLRAASLLTKTCSSTIKALTLLRELSDGFQYKEVEKGTDPCPDCHGKMIINRTVDLDDPDNPLDQESLVRGHRVHWGKYEDGKDDQIVGQLETPLNLGIQEIKCDNCRDGRVTRYEREAISVECPKDQLMFDLLEQYEEEGRTVFWAGFTESVERCTRNCLKAGWPVVRLDGRGWWSNTFDALDGPSILAAFDDKERYPKIAFVGQPGAGGMGLNLTASSMEAYYSNTFKGEDRTQSEDRIHRPGADHNRGCTIYDFVHLPQDLWVLDSLKKKRDLQAMTLGQLAKIYAEEERTT